MTACKLDAMDLTILAILEDEGRLSTRILAARTGLTQRQCQERITALERDGHIGGYTLIRNYPDPSFRPVSACIRIALAPGRNGEDLYRSMETITEISTAELLDNDHSVLIRLQTINKDRLKAIAHFFEAQFAVLSLEVSTTQPLVNHRPAPSSTVQHHRLLPADGAHLRKETCNEPHT